MRACGVLGCCVLACAGLGCRLGFEDTTLVPGAPLGCTGFRGPQVDLADPNLAAYWSFNERVLPVPDHAAPGNVANFTGPSFTAGGIGAAVKMDDATGVMVAATPALDVGDGDFTIEVWAKIFETCSPAAPLVVRRDATLGWSIGCSVGGFATWSVTTAAGTATIQSLGAVNDATYHHFAGVRRDGALELWVDGQLQDISVNTVLGAPDAAVALEIGTALYSDLDEVRLWREARDEFDIARAATELRPGLVAYWSFDADARGFAGLGNDASPVGELDLGATGRSGKAVAFGAGGGRLESAMPDVFAASYTATAWFRTPGGTGMQQILDREPEGDERSPLHLWLADGTIATNVRSLDGTGVGGEVNLDLTDDCWHHVAVVREGADLTAGSVRLYVDGEKQLDVQGTFGTTADGTDPFRIGFRLERDPRPFRGSIDEVQVYDRALTDAEIAGIHATLR